MLGPRGGLSYSSIEQRRCRRRFFCFGFFLRRCFFFRLSLGSPPSPKRAFPKTNAPCCRRPSGRGLRLQRRASTRAERAQEGVQKKEEIVFSLGRRTSHRRQADFNKKPSPAPSLAPRAKLPPHEDESSGFGCPRSNEREKEREPVSCTPEAREHPSSMECVEPLFFRVVSLAKRVSGRTFVCLEKKKLNSSQNACSLTAGASRRTLPVHDVDLDGPRRLEGPVRVVDEAPGGASGPGRGAQGDERAGQEMVRTRRQNEASLLCPLRFWWKWLVLCVEGFRSHACAEFHHQSRRGKGRQRGTKKGATSASNRAIKNVLLPSSSSLTSTIEKPKPPRHKTGSRRRWNTTLWTSPSA